MGLILRNNLRALEIHIVVVAVMHLVHVDGGLAIAVLGLILYMTGGFLILNPKVKHSYLSAVSVFVIIVVIEVKNLGKPAFEPFSENVAIEKLAYVLWNPENLVGVGTIVFFGITALLPALLIYAGLLLRKHFKLIRMQEKIHRQLTKPFLRNNLRALEIFIITAGIVALVFYKESLIISWLMVAIGHTAGGFLFLNPSVKRAFLSTGSVFALLALIALDLNIFFGVVLGDQLVFAFILCLLLYAGLFLRRVVDKMGHQETESGRK